MDAGDLGRRDENRPGIVGILLLRLPWDSQQLTGKSTGRHFNIKKCRKNKAPL